MPISARTATIEPDTIALGLILCAGKSDEHVELLRLDNAGVRVAAYLTELPARELLERKLHDAVRAARARLEGRIAGEAGW